MIELKMALDFIRSILLISISMLSIESRTLNRHQYSVCIRNSQFSEKRFKVGDAVA